MRAEVPESSLVLPWKDKQAKAYTPACSVQQVAGKVATCMAIMEVLREVAISRRD